MGLMGEGVRQSITTCWNCLKNEGFVCPATVLSPGVESDMIKVTDDKQVEWLTIIVKTEPDEAIPRPRENSLGSKT